MPRPAIGICAAVERVSWGVWDGYEVALAPRNYVDAVQRAGGLAIVLPPDAAAVEDPDLLLDRVDALLLAGGADIDPASYGAEPHAETKGTWPERDRFELALVRRALERDMPLLGICRGMQLLNVAFGGTLDQHLPETVESELHRSIAGTFGSHRVRLAPGTLACGAAQSEGLMVWSHHHQGVERLGEGLVVSGWSVEDDLVEAIELPDRRYALGVVWHPEEDADSPVIASLVAAARGAFCPDSDQKAPSPQGSVGI
ncbi:MAG: gamma-glutamyl-gamma-aminobutyrate hydrolase family protein [Solirubrobacterales bacterium]|nr:gamma-glutamyl-gamma-aminobutyrate hydrolase family protein [Solirubrobacterales bacterium]